MTVKYIFHSGFLLETAASCYIFDYYQGRLPPFDTKKLVVVFSSHAHRDHYNPEIFSILRETGVTDIFAVLAKDIPEKKYPKDIKVLKAYAGALYTLPRGEKLETLLSTDSGVAFLLTTEEGTVFHAGDLNDWSWNGEDDGDNRQMRGSYRHEIDKLKGRELDVAFIPLDPRQDEHYADGFCYFLSTVGAKSVYPMHYWSKPDVIDRFLREYPQYESVVKYTEKEL